MATGTFPLLVLLSAAVPRAAAQAPDEGGTRRWALLVGIDAYQDEAIADLRFADDDARALRTVLVDGGWDPANIVVMTPDGPEALRPTCTNVIAQLGALGSVLDEDDELLVAISAHGVSRVEPDGTHDYVLPLDASLVMAADTSLDLVRLIGLIERIPSRRRMILLDACRNALTADTRAIEAVDTWVDPNLSVGTGTRVLYATEFGAPSYELSDVGLGLLTSAVVEGLRGSADGISRERPADGVVDSDELHAFVERRLADRCAHARLCQKPHSGGTWAGAFPLTRAVAESSAELCPDGAVTGLEARMRLAMSRRDFQEAVDLGQFLRDRLACVGGSPTAPELSRWFQWAGVAAWEIGEDQLAESFFKAGMSYWPRTPFDRSTARLANSDAEALFVKMGGATRLKAAPTLLTASGVIVALGGGTLLGVSYSEYRGLETCIQQENSVICDESELDDLARARASNYLGGGLAVAGGGLLVGGGSIWIYTEGRTAVPVVAWRGRW